MKIKFQNKTYTFKLHKFENEIFFESPITGELILIPNDILDYAYIILHQYLFDNC